MILITSISNMKNGSTIKNIDLALANLPASSKSKQSDADTESPMRMDLKLKIPHHSNSSNPSNFKTKMGDSKSKEKELQTTELLLTERSNRINEFFLPTKESMLPPTGKGSNIKSYLRIKPNKNTTFKPMEIYNNQTIICDRSVYKFDFIFEPQTPQEKIYEVVGKDVTHQFIEGYNGTIFAYGSTGSGKTFTMFGNDDGLVPSVVQEVFAKMDVNCKLSCSMIEIYKENLIDLLTLDSEVELKIKDVFGNCTIQNLSIHEVKSQADTLDLIKKGNHLKKIRETHLNQSSSRSHIVFTLYLEKLDSEGKPIRCKFNLVDLAGSQKVFKSKVQGQGLEEAKKINLSLSCLGNTISALVKNSDHIPYRESKLTRILKESLMGNSITRLIVTCSINQESLEETISSIKFAQRAQKVQTQASIAYNINKFKGEKEEMHRIIRQTLQQAEGKLGKIGQVFNGQQNQCIKCKEVQSILRRRADDITAEDMFNFKPIQEFKSPKSRIDIRGYFSTGSVEKFSSVNKKDTVSKKSSAKHTLVVHREGNSPEYKALMNKRVFQLKNENERLKEEKLKLETRIKILEEKMIVQEKETKATNNGAKKVIRLGQAQQNRALKSVKENILSHPSNDQCLKVQRREDILKTEGSLNTIIKIQTQATTCKQNDRHTELQTALLLINEAISKLDTASSEYRRIICPMEIEILSGQVSYLQNQVVQHYKSSGIKKQEAKTGSICRFLLQLKLKLCLMFEDMSHIFEKLFEVAVSESKEQLSQIFKDRCRQISDIKWNFKEFIEQNDQLMQINTLLERSKSLGHMRMKTNDMEKLDTSLNEENQFLNLNPNSYQVLPSRNELKLF